LTSFDGAAQPWRNAPSQAGLVKNREAQSCCASTAGISIGAALAVTGVPLLAAGQYPKRYDDKNVDVLSSLPSWQPLVSVGPAGEGLGLAGRF